MNRPARKTRPTPAAPGAAPAAAGSSGLADSSLFPPMATIAQQLRSWVDGVTGFAGPLSDLSMSAAQVRAKRPEQKAAIRKAGQQLRDWREAAGLTVQDVAQAIDLRDASAIERAESGAAALPFELVLRLAGVLGRRDPIAFMMKLTRSYNPELWRALEDMGIGRLVVQAGREREFANLYRAHDAARTLSDEEFAALLAFMTGALEMALEFYGRTEVRNARRSTE